MSHGCTVSPIVHTIRPGDPIASENAAAEAQLKVIIEHLTEYSQRGDNLSNDSTVGLLIGARKRRNALEALLENDFPYSMALLATIKKRAPYSLLALLRNESR